MSKARAAIVVLGDTLLIARAGVIGAGANMQLQRKQPANFYKEGPLHLRRRF